VVALRSTRQDRALLFTVWALTLVVLAAGIATINPVLLLWGVVGLPGAIFMTRIHIRDTRRAASSGDGSSADPAEPTGAGDRSERESQ
jgi:hypothetical protein